MNLSVHLNVHVRFLGIDVARIDRRFSLPVFQRVARLLTFSERGVTLTVDVVEALDGAPARPGQVSSGVRP